MRGEWKQVWRSRSSGRWGEVSLVEKKQKLFIRISELRNTPDVIFCQSRYTELLRKKNPKAIEIFFMVQYFAENRKIFTFVKNKVFYVFFTLGPIVKFTIGPSVKKVHIFRFSAKYCTMKKISIAL